MSIALIPLADGFEEIEAITIIDVLRRAEVEVITAGLTDRLVTGSHQIQVHCDRLLGEINLAEITLIVLPGGPGVRLLLESALLLEMLQNHYQCGKLTAAICAAPLILSKVGILQGRRCTSFPSVQAEIDCGEYLTHPVVIDGNVVTGRGPGTAMAFSLQLVEMLQGNTLVLKLKQEMLID